MRTKISGLAILTFICTALPASAPAQQACPTHQKISDTAGGFTGILINSDRFGRSVASIGDLDGDGVAELAVGAYLDNDGGINRGAVWVLFLNNNGTVKSHQKISDSEGGFAGMLDNDDRFGGSLASIGDLDADGVADLEPIPEIVLTPDT